jgi:hypothetical protein
MLLAAFLALTVQWRSVFCQQRLLARAQRQALGALLVLGRATLARILWANGREQHSWSAEYFLHSRAQWDPQALFAPLLKAGLPGVPGGWSAWRWTIRGCAKPVVASRKLPITAIPCHRRFIPT